MRATYLRIVFLIASLTLITACDPTQYTPNTLRVYKIEDVVEGDVWQVKVISVRKDTILSRVDPAPVKKASVQKSWSANEGYSFLVVEVQINNTSMGSETFDSNSLTLTDSEKRIYNPVGSGLVFNDMVSYELNAAWTTTITGPGKIGDKTSSYIVFLVPDDAKGFYFRFQDLPSIDLFK